MSNDRHEPAEAERLPRVSIILPARNEDAFIRRTLASLRVLSYPHDLYEVIVVDNGSTDSTRDIAREMGASVIEHPEGHVGALRNVGAWAATGRILAFLDADCLASGNWLTSAVSALAGCGVGAVGGGCTAPDDGTWVERAWAPGVPTSRHDVQALAASSLVISRALFTDLGGFDEGLVAGEDDDLSRRIIESGRRLVILPECNVVHLGYPKTLAGVLRRQIWHGRSQLQVMDGPDLLLVLTHFFAIDVGLFALSAAIGAVGRATLALSASWVFAAIAAVRRTRGLGRTVLPLTAVLWFFLLGRSIGLVVSYWDLLRQLLRGGGKAGPGTGISE